jgi:hypothetical protein
VWPQTVARGTDWFKNLNPDSFHDEVTTTFATNTRAREEQADKLAGECLTIADEVKADSAQVAKARLQVDVRKWHAGKLAPKKYGDHISHDVKGPGPDFQPAIYITDDGQPLDEFARLQPASEEAEGVLLHGNGDIARGR